MNTLARHVPIDTQTAWALAVAMQAMSASALEGFSVQRTQAVVEHLRTAAEAHTAGTELRTTCERLCDLWETIDLI